MRLLAEKAYPDLQAEAQEALALYRFLTQLDNPQVNFAVRQKQPATVDQALQYTLETESYLNSYKQKVAPATSRLPQDNDFAEQLVAATPNKESPMSVIMKRLDDIECQLTSVSSSRKKWEHSRSSTRNSSQFQGQVKAPVVCFKCGQEGHFARGCAARTKVSNISQGDKQANQPMNAVSQSVHKNNTSAGDTIPAVSAHVTTDHSLQGTITGIPARFLVDTGAAASILSKQVWDKVSKQQEASLEVVSGRNLIGVEGSPLKILGAVHLQVIFERQQFNVCFLVADSLTTEAILGRDFLKDNSCVIDVGKNLITFGNVGFTLKLNCLAGDSQIAHVSVTLSNTLQVPACCEVEVMVNVPDGIAGGTWIVEGNTSTRQALY